MWMLGVADGTFLISIYCCCFLLLFFQLLLGNFYLSSFHKHVLKYFFLNISLRS